MYFSHIFTHTHMHIYMCLCVYICTWHFTYIYTYVVMGHADASYVHMWHYAYVLIGHDVKCVSYTMTRGQGFYFCFLGFFWCSLSCDMGGLSCVIQDLSLLHPDSLVGVCKLSSCDSNLVALQQDPSSQTRGIHVLCFARQILNPWTIREVPRLSF